MGAYAVSSNGDRPAAAKHQSASRGLLRFTTAGSVDDGKSTLIGRLLVDSRQVADDQLAQVQEASRRRYGDGALDLALLTDGLRAEREQGITIDVAYRYFTTERRFILADVPGHREYTRNMVTGASTADLSIVLVDVHRGVVEQSRRHAYISALLGIPHLVVAVNKMDLVDYDQAAFAEVADTFEEIATALAIPDRLVIPVSALYGDNVVTRSERMPWYQGPTLLEHLEQVELPYEHPERVSARFPVQWIIRAPNGNPNGNYRGYAGQVASGVLRAGDEVVLAPSGRRTRIAGIVTSDGPLEEAVAPQSVSLMLEDELDVGRGEMVCRIDDPPTVASDLEADVCWMSAHPLEAGRRYLLKHTTRTVSTVVDELVHCMDVQTLTPQPGISSLELNDIGRVRLRAAAPLAFDPYRANRGTGSFILIDEASNDTVAAGMIVDGASPA
jgi:sulfate adenylyltransferase large subunit